MKAFSGFKAEAPARRETLPAGGYVARILDARELSYEWGAVLLIRFDIAEGEQKDFFERDYKGQTGEDKKWRGVFRLRIPKDDGTERDGWSKDTFNRSMWAVEESNAGYHWDWNEAGLGGKTVGVLYRNREWEMNGSTGWTTECCALDSAAIIREGKYKTPRDRPLPGGRKPLGSGFTEVKDGGDLPF